MKFLKYFIVLLIVGVLQSVNAQEVNPDEVVEDAVAEAEQIAAEDAELPVAEPDNEEPPPEAVEQDESEAPQVNLDEEGAPPNEELPTDDGILSLPHLPDPKYDQEGDVVWFPRIIGGSRAQVGEFPSKVSLQLRTGSHFCGGNLITNNHIISAAHCVVTEDGLVLNPTSIEIMAGDISITRNAGHHRVHRIVSHIFAHPEYNAHTMDNDIAILRVSVPFHSVEGVLVPEPLALGVPITGTVCHLAGWGATAEGSNNASPNLMRVNLEIVDTPRCNVSYQGMIGANMFCAGTMRGGRDACQGDSGGGLMCHGVITGIVSFGFGCGRPRFPGVYVDVSSYTSFIESALNFEGSHQDIPRPEFQPGSASILDKLSLSVISLLAVVSYGMF